MRYFWFKETLNKGNITGRELIAELNLPMEGLKDFIEMANMQVHAWSGRSLFESNKNNERIVFRYESNGVTVSRMVLDRDFRPCEVKVINVIDRNTHNNEQRVFACLDSTSAYEVFHWYKAKMADKPKTSICEKSRHRFYYKIRTEPHRLEIHEVIVRISKYQTMHVDTVYEYGTIKRNHDLKRSIKIKGDETEN